MSPLPPAILQVFGSRLWLVAPIGWCRQGTLLSSQKVALGSAASSRLWSNPQNFLIGGPLRYLSTSDEYLAGPPRSPLLWQWCVSVQILHIVLTFSSKEEVGRIWKMELLKESDGLGIQVSGGRGSKRSPHAIVVTQVKEGGAAHRWLDNSPLSLPPCPPLPFPRVPGLFRSVRALGITVYKDDAGAQEEVGPERF